MAIKTFSAGEQLTASDTNTYLANSGLVYIKESSGSAVGNIAVNSCFTATFDNYFVVVSVTPSSNVSLWMKLRNGTTDKSANYWWGAFYISMASATSTPTGEGNGASATTAGIRVGALNTNGIFNSWIQVGNPYVNGRTTVQAQPQASESYFRNMSGYHNEAYSADGINIIADSGTITGTVRVYGYRQA